MRQKQTEMLRFRLFLAVLGVMLLPLALNHCVLFTSECKQDSDCSSTPPTPKCVVGACQACAKDSDCPAQQRCQFQTSYPYTAQCLAQEPCDADSGSCSLPEKPANEPQDEPPVSPEEPQTSETNTKDTKTPEAEEVAVETSEPIGPKEPAEEPVPEKATHEGSTDTSDGSPPEPWPEQPSCGDAACPQKSWAVGGTQGAPQGDVGNGNGNHFGCNAVAIAPNGDSYAVGTFTKQEKFGKNPLIKGSLDRSIYMLAMDPSGNLKWSQTLDNTLFANDPSLGMVALGGTDIVVGPNQTVYTLLSLYDATNIGDELLVVVSWDSSGNFKWRTKISSKRSQGQKLVYHPNGTSGSLYVVGTFRGSFTFGTTTLTSKQDSNDILVAKLTNQGAIEWIRLYGTNANDLGVGIAAAPNSGVYVTGNYGYDNNGISFGKDSKGKEQRLAEGQGFFVLKLDPQGVPVWVQGPHGALSSVNSSALTVEPKPPHHVVLGGSYNASTSFGTLKTTTLQGKNDFFVTKLDESNGEFLWLASAGSSKDDNVTGIAVSQDNKSVYATGFFTEKMTLGTLGTTLSGATTGTDIFVVKLDNKTGSFLSGQSYGGPGYEASTSLVGWTDGGFYFTGFFDDTLTLPNTQNSPLSSKGKRTSFVWKWFP